MIKNSRNNYYGYILLLLSFLLASCIEDVTEFRFSDRSRVDLRKESGQWKLYRNNELYYIKGAHGSTRLSWLKEMGANSILVYDYELSDSLLNLADSLGLSVSVTLDINKRKENYRDESLVLEQRNYYRDIVKRYHEHPALLFWIIGNEVHLYSRMNIPIWKEVNEISRMIHTIDPYHPTTTVVAAYPTTTYQPLQVRLFAPDLDFISITRYPVSTNVRRESFSFIWGFRWPVLITEWSGNLPYWRSPKTEWDAIIEPSSTENGDRFFHYHYHFFNSISDYCLGGYVFYWGQKQERTHTSFSLILENNYKVQAFETLEYIWNGTYPENFSPRIDTFYIEGFTLGKHYLESGKDYTVTINVFDPDSDPLFIKWELREEGFYAGLFGGAAERLTEIISSSGSVMLFKENFSFTTPLEGEKYRLFVYVYDNNDYVATANIPIYLLP